MDKASTLGSALLAAILLAASAEAVSQHAVAPPDFSDLWRLSDRDRESPDTITDMLRNQLRHEQSPAVAPASSTSSNASPAQQGNHAGHVGAWDTDDGIGNGGQQHFIGQCV